MAGWKLSRADWGCTEDPRRHLAPVANAGNPLIIPSTRGNVLCQWHASAGAKGTVLSAVGSGLSKPYQVIYKLYTRRNRMEGVSKCLLPSLLVETVQLTSKNLSVCIIRLLHLHTKSRLVEVREHRTDWNVTVLKVAVSTEQQHSWSRYLCEVKQGSVTFT